MLQYLLLLVGITIIIFIYESIHNKNTQKNLVQVILIFSQIVFIVIFNIMILKIIEEYTKSNPKQIEIIGAFSVVISYFISAHLFKRK